MDFKTVLSTVQSTVVNQQEKIQIFCQSKGGWEIWLQCELFCLIFQHDPAIYRELSIKNYTSGGGAGSLDLYFVNGGLAIELKALGLARVDGSTSAGGMARPSEIKKFIADVKEDRLKVHKLNQHKAMDTGLGKISFSEARSVVVIPQFHDDTVALTGKLGEHGYSAHGMFAGFAVLHYP